MPFSSIGKKEIEDFAKQINKQMISYLGEEIIELLTPNFTTTNYNSEIICKMSIMGAFKKYFNYKMQCMICGIPYIILEGTYEDYCKIKYKAENLKKYQFDWYIDRIIPIIQKMIDAKNGKIDIQFFKNIIQEQETVKMIPKGCGGFAREKVNSINGWILKFFAYYHNGLKFSGSNIIIEDFNKLANQLLIVPFTIFDLDNKKKYEMEYKVGFIGCDQNEEKEVFPVQGWLVCQRNGK